MTVAAVAAAAKNMSKHRVVGAPLVFGNTAGTRVGGATAEPPPFETGIPPGVDGLAAGVTVGDR